MSGKCWVRAVATDGVEEDDLVGLKLEGRDVAVYNLGGRFYATDNICTHEHACLSEGFVVGDVIECPLHQGRFHIPTGAAKGAPVHVSLKTYPVKIEGGFVYVEME